MVFRSIINKGMNRGKTFSLLNRNSIANNTENTLVEKSIQRTFNIHKVLSH